MVSAAELGTVSDGTKVALQILMNGLIEFRVQKFGKADPKQAWRWWWRWWWWCEADLTVLPYA